LQSIGDAIDNTTKRAVSEVQDVFSPPRALPPAQAGEPQAVTDAREAYEAGKVAYQTARYIEAVEKFQESFEHSVGIEDEQLKAQVQSSLYYNLGQAHIQAYELDKDAKRLNQAKALLQNHLDSDPGLSDEDREQARALMDEADAKLAALEGGGEPVEPAEEGESVDEAAEGGDGDSTPPTAESPSPEGN
jgi:tetratricopeptide (TPR) repeat protein